MKRTTALILSVIFIASTAFGQNFNSSKKLKANSEGSDSPFSFKIGYNNANVLVSPEPMNLVNAKNSFHAGIVFNNIQIANKIHFQPELLYSRQGFKVGGLGNVGLQYISLPALVKLDMGKNASVLVGPQVSYLANTRIGIGNNLFSISYNGLFQKWDVSGVAGLEYKLNNKLSIGGRYLLGFTNINKNLDLDILGENKTLNDYFNLKNSTVQVYASFNL
jgi:Outer membrane protein beta-barrel domain